MSRALALSLSVGLLLGCGDDDGGVGSEADAGPTDPSIRVTVRSEAEAFGGRVLVGAFVEDPPMTPPVALDRLDEPTFPAEATLLEVPAGEYYVIGVLDFDPPSPTIPGPEDTTASVGPIEVADEDLDVMIDLPAPADPGGG